MDQLTKTRVAIATFERNLAYPLSPHHYADRAPGDFNFSRLEEIHRLIVELVDQKAAEAFTKMVASLPNMTPFLVASGFNQLAIRDWNWENKLIADITGTDSEAEALERIRQYMAKHGYGPGNYLREGFLRKHLSVQEFQAWKEQYPH